jgi:uncharacterized protein (TIGR03086 family)
MTTALVSHSLMTDAGDSVRALVRSAAGAPLDVRTPCEEWNLGRLVQHQLYYTPILAASGRRVETSVSGGQLDVSLDAWADELDSAIADLAAVWSTPEAWSGLTSMSGSNPMPAEMIGGMVLGELVVHGWDLARAAGVEPEFSDEVLAGTMVAVTSMAELGRGMGIFGAEVVVDLDSPLLDRIVALTGRDPHWNK